MYYQSRYHLTNGRISLALDSLTGELLELVYEKTGENLIKNHCYSLPQPFVVLCGEGKCRLYPGDAGAIEKHPQLRPQIQVGQEGRRAQVQYQALWDGSGPRSVQVTYTVELSEAGDDSFWNIQVCNRSDLCLEEVRFPCINGVYLGESWKDDTLVFPHIGGLKIEDPVSSLGAPGSSIQWRWQNYRYVYPMGSLAADFPEGTHGLEDSYSGLLSMKWMGYYGEGMGMYFACHDPEWNVCSMRADTFGEKSWETGGRRRWVWWHCTRETGTRAPTGTARSTEASPLRRLPGPCGLRKTRDLWPITISSIKTGELSTALKTSPACWRKPGPWG